MRNTFTAAVIVAIAVCLTAAASFAQDADTTYRWKKSLTVDLTATQAAYSDSWTGGEVGSFNWVSNLNGAAEKQFNPWFNLRSTLKLSFGQTVTQDDSTKNWSKPKKSTDLIDWDNVGRLTVDAYVDPFVGFRLESQFLDASVEAKNRYFTPMQLTQSAGVAHQFYSRGENELVTSRLGLAIREIITQDIVDSTTYATETNTATDGGLISVTDVVLNVRDDLQYTGKLTFFKALYFSKKDEVAGTPRADYWKAIDVNWENIVTAQITKIVAVNFYAQFLYDKQISTRGRLKETLGIGFLFKLL
jgi:hypothetical protein